jgi:hypothetical protein
MEALFVSAWVLYDSSDPFRFFLGAGRPRNAHGGGFGT